MCNVRVRRCVVLTPPLPCVSAGSPGVHQGHRECPGARCGPVTGVWRPAHCSTLQAEVSSDWCRAGMLLRHHSGLYQPFGSSHDDFTITAIYGVDGGAEGSCL